MSESYPPLPPNFPQTDYLFYPSPTFQKSHPPPPPVPATPKTEYLVLFTPGNPGLIGYYVPFLSHLSTLLRQRHGSAHNISILGISHAGFATHESESASSFQPPKPQPSSWTKVVRVGNKHHHHKPPKSGSEDNNWTKWGPGPYELTAQVGMKKELMKFLTEWFFVERGTDVKFVVLTHSVGGYIALETVRVLLDARASNGSINGVGRIKMETEKKAPLLTYIPPLPTLLQRLASLLTLLPLNILSALLTLFTGFSPSKNSHAFTATLNFLRSPGGVEQALFLARDEMQKIKHDVWGEEIWGSKEGAHMGRKWVMYFGQGDHWVADSARDKLIKSRGRRNVPLTDEDDDKWKPEMLICEERLPHGFCIDHGEIMAKKVVGWVDDIIAAAEA
ncbi:hypothetical protein DFH27DRAFT_608596 [Peziza echinospora]|nr:hypothetical protein DFH27DRAFT_608596 [Peziza echinospora]